MLMAVSGLGLIVSDQLGQASPPPMPVATTPPPEPAPTTPPPKQAATTPPPKPINTTGGSSRQGIASPTPDPISTQLPTTNARPVRLDIGAIDVAAPLIAVGNAPDGTIGIPPENKPYLAAWYKYSAAPGEPGRTVIVGHLDSMFSRTYTAVFYRLGALKRGQKVSVRRADGIVVEYVIDGASLQSKANFPTGQIYGKSERSELRLITCGGTYDKATGWSGNVIIYGHMVSWHHVTAPERKKPMHYDTPSR
ncbi:Sortase family protein [Actinopolymorpha singaporensis]|uniref:Sortase family protein n=2 Tax=Actinopolymorpha singaporensis TaxID=117157 RepID=A0A1H1XES8_9ACTN|nr:Sortase family protein [Actinopolymorpha singaporensis]